MFTNLLASAVPTWQIATIIVLCVLIIGVAIFNVYNAVLMHKKWQNEEQQEEQSATLEVNSQYDITVTAKQQEEQQTQDAPPAEQQPVQEAMQQPVEDKVETFAEEVEEDAAQEREEQEEITQEEMQNMTELEQPLTIMDTDGEIAEKVERVDYATDTAIVIRYRKSFLAKLIQCRDDSKEWYGQLKNYFLSFKKVKTRISWNYDSVNSGRNQLAKFGVRGKTLCVYFALNPDDYAESKYKVERCDSKKYDLVPCLYRIKNPRRAAYAMELFDILAEKFGLEKGEEQNENYYLPYEHNQPLIDRGLIKEYYTRESYAAFLKKQANGPESCEDEDEEISDEWIEQVRSVNSTTGVAFINRYNKAFMFNLLASTEQVRDYYYQLKDEILSYNWTKGDDVYMINPDERFTVAKLEMNDGKLEMYLAIDTAQTAGAYAVAGAQYKASPCPYYIRNGADVKGAKDMIADLAQKFGREKRENIKPVNYITPDDIKEYEALGNDFKMLEQSSYEEFDIAHFRIEIAKMHRNSVSAVTADEIIKDEIAENLVEDSHSQVKYVGKKSIINIDTICANFEKDEVVSLEALKQKGVIPQNIVYVKVLARGTLDKPLTIEAQDFSLAAVKMIVLTGGTARKV